MSHEPRVIEATSLLLRYVVISVTEQTSNEQRKCLTQTKETRERARARASRIATQPPPTALIIKLYALITL